MADNNGMSRRQALKGGSALAVAIGTGYYIDLIKSARAATSGDPRILMDDQGIVPDEIGEATIDSGDWKFYTGGNVHNLSNNAEKIADFTQSPPEIDSVINTTELNHKSAQDVSVSIYSCLQDGFIVGLDVRNGCKVIDPINDVANFAAGLESASAYIENNSRYGTVFCPVVDTNGNQAKINDGNTASIGDTQSLASQTFIQFKMPTASRPPMGGLICANTTGPSIVLESGGSSAQKLCQYDMYLDGDGTGGPLIEIKEGVANKYKIFMENAADGIKVSQCVNSRILIYAKLEDSNANIVDAQGSVDKSIWKMFLENDFNKAFTTENLSTGNAGRVIFLDTLMENATGTEFINLPNGEDFRIYNSQVGQQAGTGTNGIVVNSPGQVIINNCYFTDLDTAIDINGTAGHIVIGMGNWWNKFNVNTAIDILNDPSNESYTPPSQIIGTSVSYPSGASNLYTANVSTV